MTTTSFKVENKDFKKFLMGVRSGGLYTTTGSRSAKKYLFDSFYILPEPSGIRVLAKDTPYKKIMQRSFLTVNMEHVGDPIPIKSATEFLASLKQLDEIVTVKFENGILSVFDSDTVLTSTPGIEDEELDASIKGVKELDAIYVFHGDALSFEVPNVKVDYNCVYTGLPKAKLDKVAGAAADFVKSNIIKVILDEKGIRFVTKNAGTIKDSSTMVQSVNNVEIPSTLKPEKVVAVKGLLEIISAIDVSTIDVYARVDGKQQLSLWIRAKGLHSEHNFCMATAIEEIKESEEVNEAIGQSIDE